MSRTNVPPAKWRLADTVLVLNATNADIQSVLHVGGRWLHRWQCRACSCDFAARPVGGGGRRGRCGAGLCVMALAAVGCAAGDTAGRGPPTPAGSAMTLAGAEEPVLRGTAQRALAARLNRATPPRHACWCPDAHGCRCGRPAAARGGPVQLLRLLWRWRGLARGGTLPASVALPVLCPRPCRRWTVPRTQRRARVRAGS